MFHSGMKYAAGDVYHALRGKVVETTKQGEGWRQAEQFEAAQRAKMGEGNERRDRDANGKILSGAQQRNLKNSEGTVDWRSKFSADERYSHVDFGVAKRRRDESVDIDKIAAAAKAFAAQKTAGSDAGSSLGVGATEAGGGAPDSGSKRKRDGDAADDAAVKRTPAPHVGLEPSTSGPPPPFALPPPDANLAKRIETVAGFVHKNGQKFEEVTRAKQRGNPEFAFLDPGGEGEEYYAWLRHALRAGIDPKKPPGVDPTFDPVALAAAARKIAEEIAKSSEAAEQERRTRDPGEGDAAHEGAKGGQVRVGPWQAVKDSSGRTYYWNRDTQATTWTPPDGF